jgi:hypothetical protein
VLSDNMLSYIFCFENFTHSLHIIFLHTLPHIIHTLPHIMNTFFICYTLYLTSCTPILYHIPTHPTSYNAHLPHIIHTLPHIMHAHPPSYHAHILPHHTSLISYTPSFTSYCTLSPFMHTLLISCTPSLNYSHPSLTHKPRIFSAPLSSIPYAFSLRVSNSTIIHCRL